MAQAMMIGQGIPATTAKKNHQLIHLCIDDTILDIPLFR